MVVQPEIRVSMRLGGTGHRPRVLGLLQPGTGAVPGLHPHREGGQHVRQTGGRRWKNFSRSPVFAWLN